MARRRLLRKARARLQALALLVIGTLGGSALSVRAADAPGDTRSPSASSPAPGAADTASPDAFFRPNAVKMTPEVRERLAQLLQLPKEQLWTELMNWPAFKEMSLQQQAEFVNRLALMREHIRTQALKKAAELGIAVPPDKEDAFINSYIEERLVLERKIWQETQIKRRELDEQLKTDLKKQYLGTSTETGGTPAPAAHP